MHHPSSLFWSKAFFSREWCAQGDLFLDPKHTVGWAGCGRGPSSRTSRGRDWSVLNASFHPNSTRVYDRLAGQTGLFAKIPTTRAPPALGTAILHMIVFVLSSLCTSTYLSTSVYPPWTCIFTYLGGREHSKRRQVFDGQNYLLKLGGVLAKSRVEYPTLGRTLHFTDITQA